MMATAMETNFTDNIISKKKKNNKLKARTI